MSLETFVSTCISFWTNLTKSEGVPGRPETYATCMVTWKVMSALLLTLHPPSFSDSLALPQWYFLWVNFEMFFMVRVVCRIVSGA